MIRPIAVFIGALSMVSFGQSGPNRGAAANGDVHVLPAQGSVYMMVGPSGNTVAQVGKDGILLVDTQSAAMAPKIFAEAKKLNSGDLGASAGEGAAIIAHENVLNRMSAPTGKQAPTPAGAWPTSTFFNDEKKLFFNGE